MAVHAPQAQGRDEVVRGVDPRRQRLCLERKPGSSEIILVPDTYTLRRQLDAV
ncbi:hypothetical protein [Sorangium sp. So ce128]|uniref:hypothetical protein n=1 Tax=Sorangium sp. So ce128 TaxID=3133281 RepID=UPI003F645EB6